MPPRPPGDPRDGSRSSIPPGGGVMSSSLLFRHGGDRRLARGEIDQLDPQAARDVEDPIVPVELAVDDPLDPGVGDQLEAGPAGARARVDVRALDADTAACRLQDCVPLGVGGGAAVPVLPPATDIVAGGESPDAAVGSGGKGGPVARPRRPRMLWIASPARPAAR